MIHYLERKLDRWFTETEKLDRNSASKMPDRTRDRHGDRERQTWRQRWRQRETHGDREIGRASCRERV